tara:strand:- start:6707 stop:7072 length:366 start_codon:yes stop_codon:yes gene_type:complete
MSWENILKRSGNIKKINMPLLREALGNATATLAEFTLPEILPLAQELYREYLIRDGIYANDRLGRSNATRHSTGVFDNPRGRTSFFGKVINNLGVHKPTTRMKTLPTGTNETIYARREETR